MNVRPPAVAGIFYPANQKELAAQVTKFVGGQPTKIRGTLKAVIVPHAGYIYSGMIAGKAFQLFKSLNQKTKWEVLLIGPSHTLAFEGASLSLAKKWETPLGPVPLSSHAQEFLSPLLHNAEEAHWQEHCLEVELPFLQKTLDNFCIIPIVAGRIEGEVLGIELENKIKKNTLIVTSSDLSHYLPYNKAVARDRKTINAILALDTQQMEAAGDACGKIPIQTLLHLAKTNKWKPVLLDYKNSGDAAGNKNRVVGYAAIAFMEQ